jgi:hypothetical protein
MKLHRIRSPLAPLNKGGTGKTSIKVPLFKGDLGGSRYVQLHIKLVLVLSVIENLKTPKFHQIRGINQS